MGSRSLTSFFREYGFKVTFVIYWLMYLPVLFIYANEIELNQNIVKTVGEFSFLTLILGTIFTFRLSKLPEDYNLDFFSLCIGSIVTKCLVRVAVFYGYSTPWEILIAQFAFMAVYCVIIFGVWFNKYIKNKRYFNR